MTRILVKMPNWVGDCVMATPALNLMRTALPGATIDVMCRPSVAGILLDNPHLSEVVVMQDKNLSGQDMATLRGAKYDALALMTNSMGSAWLGVRLGIKKRIGFNREGRGLLLTERIGFDPYEWTTPTPEPLSRRSLKGEPRRGMPRHMVEYYLEVARRTLGALGVDGGSGFPEMDYRMVLPLNRLAETKVADMLRRDGIMGKTLIGVNPGAAHGPAKRWSPERLGHVIEGLNRPGWAFVSTAAPGEKELNDRMQKETGVTVHRLGEETTLRELPALISRLSVLVTNDSGAMHVAAARQIPTVAIFGPTDWANTQAWQAPTSVIRNPVPCSPCFLEKCPINHPCMDGIDNFDVAVAVMDWLYRTNRWSAAS